MKKELNADWSLNLSEMRPTWADKEDVAREKIARLVDYVESESDGYFYMDKYSGYIVQKKALPWSYVFDVIKNAPKLGFVVYMKLPPRFKVRKPKPVRGTMYAYYDSENDAIKLHTYTGERREEFAGYDGWGREPDELEVIEGLRNRNSNWIDELKLKWI